jgi:salicylate hydroxylase
MQHHPYPPSETLKHIPLEKVPPLYDGRRAALSLNIIIVGAGIAGLAATHTLAHAGHRITLLESASVLGDVGAGLQVSPNATRLLHQWGLRQALAEVAVEPTALVFRRYDTGTRVGYTRWGARMVEDHGSPYYHIHRGDYHAMLLHLARAAPGVRIRLNAAVRDVQPDPTVQDGPSVTLASGEVLHADVVIGADGVKSTVQKAVTGHDDAPMPTGDAAYRAIVSTDLMLQDPELRQFVETPEMTGWMAPRRHLMAYNIVRAISFSLNVNAASRKSDNVDLMLRSVRRKSSTWYYSTPTMDRSNRGQRKAAETRCVPILRTLSQRA